MKLVILFIQVFLIIVIAPFLSGFIRKLKNNFRMRKGQSVFQPYYNLFKLCVKGEVISENSSWVFRIAPFMYLASAITALFLIPVFSTGISLNSMGDFLAIIFVFSFGRFFLALAGLDSASAFTGMGSSREMFISSFLEPLILLSAFVVSLNAGSTSFQAAGAIFDMRLSSVIAAVSLFIVLIAETSRLPVDNQETHLELTMVHEAMLLEYSGSRLALIELATHIKQAVFFSLVANIVLPWRIVNLFNFPQFFSGIQIYLVKILVIAVVVAVLEVSLAKMRLFRLVDFFGFSFVLAIIALVVQAIGL